MFFGDKIICTGRNFTQEFEEALFEAGCFSIMERREYARLMRQKDNEKAIMSIEGITDMSLGEFKALHAEAMIFGEVYDDVESGELKIRVEVTNLHGEKLQVQGVRMSRGKSHDAESRELLMQELAHSLCQKAPVSLPDIQIDSGILEEYFTIENVRLEQKKFKDVLGRITMFEALTFTVEAKESFTMAAFAAKFYDAEEIEVDSFATVTFEPDYSSYRWEPGTRSRASVMLPIDFSKVKIIKFSHLF